MPKFGKWIVEVSPHIWSEDLFHPPAHALRRLGFTRLMPKGEHDPVWYHPNHWQLCSKGKSDYWVEPYYFKARTDEARAWAKENVVLM